MKTTATLLLALANPATAELYNMKWYASADCTGAVLINSGAEENNIFTDNCYVTSSSAGNEKSAKLLDPSGVIGTVTYPSVDCTGTAGVCPSFVMSADNDCVTSVTAGTCKAVDQNGAKSVMVTVTTKPTTIGTVSPAFVMQLYDSTDCTGAFTTSFRGQSLQVAADACDGPQSSTGMYQKIFQDTADATKLWKMTHRTSATCLDSAPDMPMFQHSIPTDTCYPFLTSSSVKLVLGQVPASSATSASIGIVAVGLAVAAAAVIA